MDLIVYKIPGVATLTIGTKQNVAAKLRDYERRFSGAQYLVNYVASHDGRISLGYEEQKTEGGHESVVKMPLHIESNIKAKEPLRKLPLIFEQLTYFFDIEFDPSLVGLEESTMFVKHYLSEFTDNFNSRGRLMHGQFSFVNEPGAFHLEVHYQLGKLDQSFWFDFTVASTKMDVLQDYRAILRAIERWDRSLVFSEKAKTLHEVQKAGRAEPDEAKRWVVYFEKSFDVYETALKRILHDPYNRMVTSPYFHRADQVRRWTVPMVRELERYRRDGARLAHHRFLDNVHEMTFDTQENRFVKFTVQKLLLMLQAAAVQFRDDEDYSDQYKRGLKERINRFRRYLRDPRFADVGAFTGEANSLVMQMRPGYSDIRVVWVLMNSLFTSDISLGQARNPSVGLAKLSALYEFWCYLMVKEIMDGIMSEKFGISPTASGTVAAKKAVESATLEEDKGDVVPVVFDYKKPDGTMVAQVIFQQSYGPRGGADGFAGPFQQRPDIVVTLRDQKNVYTYLFDAKYRIEKSAYTGFKDAAPRDALDQMHRYRDAILWRKTSGSTDEIMHEVVGAYILYPADTSKAESVPIFDYTLTLSEQNIGAFPLLPNRSDGLKKFLHGLVGKLDANAVTSAWLLDSRQVIPQKGLYYTDTEADVIDDASSVDVQLESNHDSDFELLQRALSAKIFPVSNSLLESQGKKRESVRRLNFKVDNKVAYVRGRFPGSMIQQAQLNRLRITVSTPPPYYIFEIE